MKKEIIEAYFDLDADGFAQYLTNNYLDKNYKNLTKDQIDVIDKYKSRLKEDFNEEFYDSEEQEEILNTIFGYFGITEEDFN